MWLTRRAVNLHPPRVRPRRRKNTVKIPGSRWTAERSPECASLSLLCRTSTSLGACGWPTGCLVLSSVRGLQMNVCRINGAQHLVERSHECPRRSDQTISMHTRRPCRVWMGLSPSIELNHPNGKSLCMPRRIAQKPQRIATSPALRRKSGSQQAAVLEDAAKGALYRKSSRFAASGCASEPLAPRRPTSGRWAAGELSLRQPMHRFADKIQKAHLRPSSAQSTSRAPS